MKKLTHFLTGLLFLTTLEMAAQSPAWTQAYAIGAGGFDFCRGIGTDSSENTYLGGLFSYTVDFQPGPGYASGAAIGYSDFYIASYTNTGQMRWLRTMGGAGTSVDMGVFYTDANGNAYASGYFLGSIDFDGTTSTDIRTSAPGAFDIFLTSYDASGNYRFTITFPGNSLFNMGRAINVDATGNIYLSGYFSGDVDFDGGQGQAVMVGQGLRDIFIAKYNSTGAFQWVKKIANADNQTVYDLTTSDDGYLYLTGSFEGTLDFDPGPGISYSTSQGNTDIFILKLDTAGNYIWNKRIGDTDIDEGQKITLGVNGELYATGYFGWYTDFDPGNGNTTLASAGSNDIFILKLDTAGNFKWARSVGSLNLDEGIDIRTGTNGEVYTYSIFRDTIDADPGTGILQLAPVLTGYSDLALICLDSGGTYQWAEQIGGDYNEYGGTISVSTTGTIWISGDFFGPTISLGTQTIANIDQFGNSNDIFFARLGGSAQGVGEDEQADPLHVYPNPSTGQFWLHGLQSNAPIEIQLFDLQGRQLLNSRMAATPQCKVELNELAAGVYCLRVNQGDQTRQVQLIIE